MIQWLHRLSKSIFATVLLGMLALSFVVWGIADVFTGNSATAVATVGGTAIDTAAFQRDYRNFLRNAGQNMGQDISPDMAQKMGMPTIALQQMVSRAALDNYAAQIGIVTSDPQVTQYIRAMDPFRGPTGQFDHNYFLRAVGAAGYDENSFIAQVRSDLTREQLTSAVETGFVLPTEYGLAMYLYLNEKRAADYVVVTPDAAGPVAAPDDKTLADFIKANPTHFSTPEYRDIQYAAISPADATVDVTDAQIAQQYEARKSTYVVPEKRELSQIEFKTEAEANAASAKLASGMSFDALAESMKLKPADTSLGTLALGDIPDGDRAKAAFALASGAVSAPVKGTFGWVILKTGKITPGINRSLDDVKDEIKTALRNDLVANKLVDIVNAFQDAKSNGNDLSAAAKKAGMKVARIPAMARDGSAPDGTKTAAPTDPEFLTAAFATLEGEDSDAITAKSGSYYVVHVGGVTPPKLKALDLVRVDASAQWTEQKRAEMAAAKAAALFAQAQKDKSLASIAAALKTSVQKSAGLSRSSNDPTFSPALLSRLFDAKPGEIVTGPTGLSGSTIIAQVTGIAHPHPAARDQAFGTAMQQTAAGVAGDLSISMASALRLEQGVKVNQKILDSVVGNGG
jgi:peptidyl-prolyl cis-trans isomerase D